jgi:hypothetical protein
MYAALQVYVDGVLLAAVLDDVVLQPLTGKLMAVMYKFYTPGTGIPGSLSICALIILCV